MRREHGGQPVRVSHWLLLRGVGILLLSYPCLHRQQQQTLLPLRPRSSGRWGGGVGPYWDGRRPECHQAARPGRRGGP